jgi:hypothetical protein
MSDPKLVRGSDWGGSAISCAQTCKQKYYFEKLQPHPAGGTGLVLVGSKIAPTKGTLLHAGLQRFYELKMHEPDRPYMERVIHAIKYSVDGIKQFDLEDSAKDLLKEELISALDQYATKYELEDLEPIAVELPVTVQVGDFVHTGIIDLLAKWQGIPYVVDHKTTSMQLAFLFKKMRFNLSLKGYCIAASEKLGEPINALVNGIRFKGTKSLECEFDREPIMYNDAERAEFPKTIKAVRQEIEMCEREGFWPKSGDQCVQIWGECDYRKLCTYPDPSMISTFYKARKA